MTDDRNLAQHRRGHEAFRRGDMDALTDVIDENTTWHVAGRSPVAGTLAGRDAVLAYFAKLAEMTDGTLELESQFFMGDGDRTVALCRLKGTRNGNTLNADFCEVVRWENGKCVEDWGFAFDQHAYDEFWS